MPENFEGGEKPKNFSEDEMQRMQALTDKVWEVVGWDLAKMCGTSEEVDMVHKAQEAMKEVGAMLNMPSGPKWEKQESKPIAPKTFSPDEMQRLRSNLIAIEEVIELYISASDEEEIGMIRDARESLKTLKGIL